MGVGETITVINKSGKVVSSVSSDKGCADKPRTDGLSAEQALCQHLQGGQVGLPRAQG
jgi:hypothetical protein